MKYRLNKDIKYVLYGKYKNSAYEEIDTATTKTELNYLIHEYRLAYGIGWTFKVQREKIK